VTCPCQHCSGKIEFDANQLDPAENTTVPCPHCEMETIIFVPEQKAPPVVSDENVSLRQVGEIENGASSSKQNDQKNIRKLGMAEVARRAAETWGTYEETRRAAERGDHLAQLSIGMKYKMGTDVAQDDQEAVRWFRKAAEQGNSLAQWWMGFAYLSGEGIAADHSEAAKWYRLAAEQGNALAQVALGDAYHIGVGVLKNFSEAIKWYRQAAEQGNDAGQFGLGVIYNNGDGVPKDFTEAAKWYRQAAEQRHADAQFRLGLAYVFGTGVVKDKVEAVRWHRLSAEQGNASAQLCLSVAYYTGDGVPQNYVEAYKWANLAAAQGNDKAKEAKAFRDELTQKMTRSQIEKGQRLSSMEPVKIKKPKNQTTENRIQGIRDLGRTYSEEPTRTNASTQMNTSHFTIVELQQGTTEWREWRHNGIGASDASTIMGENRFKSSAQLLNEKRGPAQDYGQNAAMARGTELEPEARRLYIAKTGKEVRPVCLQSTRYDWLRASLDGFAINYDAVVEIKCGQSAYRTASQTGSVPDYYYGQMQHIMAVTGLDSLDFWCYWPGYPALLIPVPRNSTYIERLLNRELEFWNLVQQSAF
jgi:hypothetical protein